MSNFFRVAGFIVTLACFIVNFVHPMLTHTSVLFACTVGWVNGVAISTAFGFLGTRRRNEL